MQLTPRYGSDPIIVIDGDPTRDISLLGNPEATVAILQKGIFYKDALGAGAAA